MDKDVINQIVDASVSAYNEQNKTNIDPKFIKAIIENESSYNPQARSNVGANGLAQIMPATAIDNGFTEEESKDPYANIALAIAHFDKSMKKFNDPILAIAYKHNKKF